MQQQFSILHLFSGIGGAALGFQHARSEHEKTKEQAQKDKNRDRLLKMAGYEVIHFTGSEIWADPSKCAREVISMLKRLWDNRKVV